MGRPLVGHAAGQPEAARQDDRLGGHAAGAWPRSASSSTDRSPPVRAAAVAAMVKTDNREFEKLLRTGSRPRGTRRSSERSRWGWARLADTEALDLLTRPCATRVGRAAARRRARGRRDDRLEESRHGPGRAAGPEDTRSPIASPRVIAALGRLKDPSAIKPLLGSAREPSPAVRSAAIDALVAIVKDSQGAGASGGRAAPFARLADPVGRGPQPGDRRGRRPGDREAIPALIAASETPESRFEAALALAAMPGSARLQVYLRGSDRQERRAAPGLGGGDRQHPRSGGRRARPARGAPRAAARSRARAPVDLHRARPGDGVARAGAVLVRFAAGIRRGQTRSTSRRAWKGFEGKRVSWQVAEAVDLKARSIWDESIPTTTIGPPTAMPSSKSPSERKAEMVVGSDDTLTVWLNGKQVYDFADRRGFEHEHDRFDVTLCERDQSRSWFAAATAAALAIRRRRHVPGRPRVSQGTSGEALQPRDLSRIRTQRAGECNARPHLFADLKGLACIKCHAVGKEGGTVGPELSSVGAKYPRDELIAVRPLPIRQDLLGLRADHVRPGRRPRLTGIVRNETADAVEIQDADAKSVRIAKDRHRRAQAQRRLADAKRPGPGT